MTKRCARASTEDPPGSAEQIRAYRVRHSSGATIDLTTAEYLTQWIADGKGEWRPNTYRLRSGTTIRHIVPYIGSRLVADLDVDDVKLLLRKLKERDVGAATRKQAHATLNAALNVLYRERKLLFNPCSLVRAPRYEPEEKIVLDRNQAMRLIAKAEGQVLVLIVMAATLALREGELFGLLWNCVDLKAGTVTIVRQLAEDLDGNLVLSPLKTKASRRTWSSRSWHGGHSSSYGRRGGVNRPTRTSLWTVRASRCARATSFAATSSRYW